MNKTFRDYLIVLFGTSIGRGVSYLNSIILARILSVNDFGKFSIFITISVLVWLLPQTFDSIFVNYAKSAKDQAEKTELLKIAIFMKFIFGGLVLVFSYPISIGLAQHVFKRPEIVLLLMGALLSGVFQSFLMSLGSVFQEKEKFGFYSVLYSSLTISLFLITLVLRIFNHSVSLNQVLMIYIGGAMVIGAIALFVLFQRYLRPPFTIHKELFQKCYKFGKWFFLAAILGNICSRLDMLFIGGYCAFKDIGIYSVGVQITMVMSLFIGSFSNVFLPKACKATVSKEKFLVFLKEAYVIMMCMAVILILLNIFADKIVHTLYTAKYTQSIAITKILLIGYIFITLLMPLYTSLSAFKDSKTLLWNNILCILFSSVCLFLFVPRFGILGAAYVTAAIPLIFLFKGLPEVIRNIKVLPSEKSGELK